MIRIMITLILLFLLACPLFASPLGSVLILDGDHDYLALFEPIINKGPFTVEAWGFMYAPGGGVYSENCLFEQRDKETGFGAATVTILAKNAHDDEASFELRDTESGRIKLAAPIQTFHQWHHYVGIVDSTSIKFYINGQLITAYDFELTGSFDVGIENIAIGRHAYHGFVAGYFNGQIDEMRIWNYARSEEEILSGMDTVIDLEDESAKSKLLAYWRFDDFYKFWKNGEHYVGIKDLSGNGHHGAFIDDAWLLPADAQTRIVPLVEFELLSPAYDELLTTDSPILLWESAAQEEHLLNSELRYNIYLDTTIAFENSLELSAQGNKNSIQLQNLAEDQYFWKVKATNAADEYKWSSGVGRFSINLSSVAGPSPISFELLQNYPNPFNPNTTIEFYLSSPARLVLGIYDLSGRPVNQLLAGEASMGSYSVVWHGDDASGHQVSAGVYFYRLDLESAEGRVRSIFKKMTLLK